MQENNLQKVTDTSIAKLTPQESDQDTKLPKEAEAITPLEGKTGETIHIHYFPDAIVILREGEEGAQETNFIDSTVAGTTTTEGNTEQKQAPEQKTEPLNGQENTRLAILSVSFNSFLILSCLLLQLYMLLNPPTAIVTIMPKSQTVTFTGMLQLGRLFNPTTVSQTATFPTTGRGHQDAKVAQGTLTFYNGLLMPQTIAAGTLLTGSSGVQIVTTEDAAILPGNPPTYGQATVSAHALHPGTRGNIPPGDIHQACCANAVLAKNTTPFHGGQDERNFQTVTKQDISTGAAPLKPVVAQSMQAALQTHMQQSEEIFRFPCAPTVRADHHVGEEAAQVTVTVAETCSAVAYDKAALQAKATELVSHQARQKLGTGYSLLGNVQVTVNQAEVSHALPTLVFSCQGTWVYALDTTSQEHIKTIIAGKTKQEALHLLASLPGIERVSMNWDERTKLPNTPSSIHIVMMYGLV
jgi:hypothetical protein